jgi:hypothetical protein
MQLRIDGRVPIEKSAQFLLQMRMNSSKELIAVAFSPSSSQLKEPFKFLIEYLLGKKYVEIPVVCSTRGLMLI